MKKANSKPSKAKALKVTAKKPAKAAKPAPKAKAKPAVKAKAPAKAKPAKAKPSAKVVAVKKATAKKPAKAAKAVKAAKPAAKVANAPAAGKTKAKAPAQAEAPKGKRGRKPNVEAADLGDAEAGMLGEPNAAALAAAEAEVKKRAAKPPRRKRVRQLPKPPPTLRNRPAWAEAWTALAEAGMDSQTISKILRDASLIFIGLGELTPQVTESLFHFWEIAEVPAGISSILEEAFLSQPLQADRKSSIEAFFKQALAASGLEDALALIMIARIFTDWKTASKRMKALHSPHAANHELFNLAHDIVS